MFGLNDLDFSGLKKARRYKKKDSEKKDIQKVSAEYHNRKILR